jgi:Ca2+-binding RTX toxin-like protein
MQGGDGDDIYVIDNKDDKVAEYDSQGIDTVFSSVNHTLDDNFENLSLATGNAGFGAGNELANTIYGNAGSNVLNGRGNADQINGLGGNDTFVFLATEASGDTIYEFEGNGAADGDLLVFSGYGTAAQGATFVHLTGDTWQITSANGLVQETIHLVGSPDIHVSDYVFV